MLDRLRYFQAIVKYQSFTEAAVQCNISQSAISQQIHSLEEEIGIQLINREKRKIQLTPEGEYFYRKSLVIVNEYDRLVKEVQQMNDTDKAHVHVGVLLTYGGEELQLTISQFVKENPTVEITITTDNHDALKEKLLNETYDIILSDQRNLFKQDMENHIVQHQNCWIEIARDNQITELDHISYSDLKNIPCIIVANKDDEQAEEMYYRDVYGFQGDFLFARTIKDARLMVVANKGFLPVDGLPVLSHFDLTISRIPFYQGNEPFQKNLCLFWKKDNSGYYIEDFAEKLEEQFKKEL